MNIKSIIAIALAAGAVVGIGFGLLSKPDVEPVAAVEAIDPSDPNRVAENAPIQMAKQAPAPAPTEAPDFDARKVAKPQVNAVEPEVMSIAKANEVIATKEKEMQQLIANYNASLDDPKAKAALERKFKIQSEEYKKALLAKVKNGDL